MKSNYLPSQLPPRSWRETLLSLAGRLQDYRINPAERSQQRGARENALELQNKQTSWQAS